MLLCKKRQRRLPLRKQPEPEGSPCAQRSMGVSCHCNVQVDDAHEFDDLTAQATRVMRVCADVAEFKQTNSRWTSCCGDLRVIERPGCGYGVVTERRVLRGQCIGVLTGAVHMLATEGADAETSMYDWGVATLPSKAPLSLHGDRHCTVLSLCNEGDEAKPHNCAAVSWPGRPFLLILACRDIEASSELLLSYGQERTATQAAKVDRMSYAYISGREVVGSDGLVWNVKTQQSRAVRPTDVALHVFPPSAAVEGIMARGFPAGEMCSASVFATNPGLCYFRPEDTKGNPLAALYHPAQRTLHLLDALGNRVALRVDMTDQLRELHLNLATWRSGEPVCTLTIAEAPPFGGI